MVLVEVDSLRKWVLELVLRGANENGEGCNCHDGWEVGVSILERRKRVTWCVEKVLEGGLNGGIHCGAAGK